jgi:hypothetical protein
MPQELLVCTARVAQAVAFTIREVLARVFYALWAVLTLVVCCRPRDAFWRLLARNLETPVPSDQTATFDADAVAAARRLVLEDEEALRGLEQLAACGAGADKKPAPAATATHHHPGEPPAATAASAAATTLPAPPPAAVSRTAGAAAHPIPAPSVPAPSPPRHLLGPDGVVLDGMEGATFHAGLKELANRPFPAPNPSAGPPQPHALPSSRSERAPRAHQSTVGPQTNIHGPDPSADLGIGLLAPVKTAPDGRVLWADRPRAENVEQGQIGDCYLIASVAALAERPGGIERCFVLDRRLPPHAYPVRLFGRDGTLRTHVLNDKVPVNSSPFAFPSSTSAPPGAGGARSLALGRSKVDGEMWVSLLEKGFVASRGGKKYDKVAGGDPCAALHALTGAAAECVNHEELVGGETELWRILSHAHASGDVVVAGTDSAARTLALVGGLFCCFHRCCNPVDLALWLLSGPRAVLRSLARKAGRVARQHCIGVHLLATAWGKALASLVSAALALPFLPLTLVCGDISVLLAVFGNSGIVPGHAYSVIGTHTVRTGAPLGGCCCCTAETRLVKLRNPHAQLEWSGSFSDNSWKWSCVSAADKAALGHATKDDGTFFMPVGEYARLFRDTGIVRARPGWGSLAVPARVTGRSAYFLLRIAADAPAVDADAVVQNPRARKAPGGSGGGGGGGGGSPGPAVVDVAGGGRGGVGEEVVVTTSPLASKQPALGSVSRVEADGSVVLSFDGGQPEGGARALAVAAAQGRAVSSVGAPPPVSSSPSAVRGVRAFVSILHADGTSPGGQLDGGQRVRVTVMHRQAGGAAAAGGGGGGAPNNTAAPPGAVTVLGSSPSEDTFTSFNMHGVCGTGEMVLEAGREYVVFAQWLRVDELMREGTKTKTTTTTTTTTTTPAGRAVTLLVTTDAPRFVTAAVPHAAPEPRLAWAPLGPTGFGTCGREGCGLPLPCDFAFVGGRRLHPECAAK